MNNKILTFVTIAAIGAGAYVYTQQASTTDYNVLDYVPADTPIFAGQLSPFPIKDYLSSAPSLIDPDAAKNVEQLQNQSRTAQEKFFLSLTKTYQNNLDNADDFVKVFGLSENVRAYFYTLGLLPVVKIEIENPEAVWTLLDSAEKESGYTHTKGKLDQVDYRAYRLFSEDDVSSDLIIAIHNGLLTATLNTSYNKPALLKTALGISKVENSLQDSSMLNEIIAKYNFKDASIGFINHVEIIKGLTTESGNQLAQQITTLNKLNDQPSDISRFRTPECVTDFNSIADNWPRTVFGYKNISITPSESTLEFSTVIESKNKVILDALSAIQGYIPSYTKDVDNLILAMGLGIDVNQVSNSLTTIWQDLQTPKYTCAPLAEMQNEFEKNGSSLSMIGMGANMANGVKGINFSLIDYAITKVNNSTQLKSLDAIVGISADNPAMLFNSLKMFAPNLQNINLKGDGTAVDVSHLYPKLAEHNIKVKLAIKGKSLVLYSGEKGKTVAETLTNEEIAKNGLYSMAFDFKRMVEPVITATELAGEAIPEEAMFMTEYDARMKLNIEINQQGIEFNSLINNKSK